MKPRQHKDVLLGYPRNASDVRICTPLGEVWVAFREDLGPSGRPGMIVTVDGADSEFIPCPVNADHWEFAHLRVTVQRDEETGRRCNRCHRPMKGSTPADGACYCGGLIEAAPKKENTDR